MKDLKEIVQKLRSVELCLTAHPDNEPNSEFEDRISDLQEIQEQIFVNNDALILVKKLKQGGRIVSSGELSTAQIANAQSCNRFFVDEDNFGYAYLPK